MTSNIAANKPRLSWRKDWLAWLIIGAIGYSTLCILSLASDIQRPFPSFLTYHYYPEARIKILWNVPSWWWSPNSEWPAITDTILSVAGVPFQNLSHPVNEQALYEKLQASGVQTVTVQLLRNDNVLSLDMPLQTFTWLNFVDFALGPIILSGSLLLLAVILYQASGGILVQRIAILILLAIASLVHTHATLFLHGQFRDHFIGYSNQINAIAVLFAGPLLLHFAFHYPTSVWQNHRRLSKIPWGLYGFALIAYGSYVLSRVFLNLQGITPVVQLFDYIGLQSVFLLLFVGFGAVFLRMVGDGFIRSVHPRAYREARLMLAAFLFAVPAFLFAALGAADSSDILANMSGLIDARFFVLAVPLAFATITLRYYPRQSLNKWLLFIWTLTASSILANIVLAILFYAHPEQISAYPIPPTLILLTLFLILGLLTNWQSSWRGWLGRLFNWERINYRAVQQFNQALISQPYQDINQLAKNVVTILSQELSLEWAACWLCEDDKLRLATVNGRYPPDPLPTYLFPPTHLHEQPQRLTPFPPPWLKPLPIQATLLLPLLISGELLGILIIGPRWDAPVFDDRDLEILTLIGQQVTLMMHNTRQTAQLRQTDQQLLHTQELTRQKTAQNLHDHLLPALGQLQLQLLTATQLSKNQQPEQAQTLLTESQQHIRETSELIRRIQKDLVIRPLQYGLSPYLQELMIQFQHDTGIPVRGQITPALDAHITDLQIREAIYAVWHQALDNVAQHAAATEVTARLEVTPAHLTFSICDNGRGCLPEEQEQAMRNGRFGLRSMQIRLTAIGGQFTFRSTPQQGSCVEVQIPIEELLGG